MSLKLKIDELFDSNKKIHVAFEQDKQKFADVHNRFLRLDVKHDELHKQHDDKFNASVVAYDAKHKEFDEKHQQQYAQLAEYKLLIEKLQQDIEFLTLELIKKEDKKIEVAEVAIEVKEEAVAEALAVAEVAQVE